MYVKPAKWRRGDLKPDLTLDLTGDGEPVDLTVASAIRVIGKRNGVVLFDRPGTGDEFGTVVLPLIAGDTSLPGTTTVEAEVMWPGNKPQTFRSKNAMVVEPDLA